MRNMASVESEIDFKSKKNSPGWERFTTAERMLFLVALFGFLVCVLLLVGLGIMVNHHIACNKTASGRIQKREISYNSTTEESNDELMKVNTTSNEELGDEVCLSPICQNEANIFLKNMNQDIDPCDDFYQFACGNFIKNAIIPDDENKIDMPSIVQKKVISKIRNEITEKIKVNESDAFKKLKIYYQNCMNQSFVDKENTKILLDIVNRLGGWPILLDDKWKNDSYVWSETLYKIQKQGYILDFPVYIVRAIDEKNTTRYIINILSARTIISRLYLLDDVDSKIMKAYYEYMVDIAVMLGANRDVALRDMKDCLDFELNIYNLKNSLDDWPSTPSSYNPITVRELSRKYPSIPWLELLNEILKPGDVQINEDEVVIIRNPVYFEGLEGLIKRTPNRVIANYIIWKIVSETVDFLPDAFLNRELSFSRVFSGVSERKVRDLTCVRSVIATFPVAVSALYVRKYAKGELREGVLELAGNVKSQFRRVLEEVDWMDEDTRKTALEKIDAMNIFIGYSDELFDDQKINDYYKDLEIDYGSYLTNTFNVSLFFKKKNFEILKKPVNQENPISKTNAVVVNANYNVKKNAISIPAALLQEPFFRIEGPQYLNYGSVGAIIGHEITHGFDNEGRKGDKNGNQIDWWEESTEQKYLEKEKCMIEQYNNYTVPEINLNINGTYTVGENIADNGGLKIAYRAYNEWASRSVAPEPRLPGLNYTARQMFWIRVATNFCGKSRIEHLRSSIVQDAHSTLAARVTVGMSNMHEFAEDFACKPGSNMNPTKKCVVW